VSVVVRVIRDVGLRTQDVGDLLLWTRRDVLVLFQLGDARLALGRDMIVDGVLVGT